MHFLISNKKWNTKIQITFPRGKWDWAPWGLVIWYHVSWTTLVQKMADGTKPLFESMPIQRDSGTNFSEISITVQAVIHDKSIWKCLQNFTIWWTYFSTVIQMWWKFHWILQQIVSYCNTFCLYYDARTIVSYATIHWDQLIGRW